MIKIGKKLCRILCALLTGATLIASASAVTVYNTDGESRYVREDQLQQMLDSGWYEYPVVTLYAEDGRSEVFPRTMKDAQLTVGWFESPEVTLYTEDGRSQVFPLSMRSAQLTVGWFESPEVTLYAADGRREIFPLSMRSAQLTVGWYEYPVITVYALDGRSSVIPKEQLEAWLAVGWYEEYTEMYTLDGWTEYVHWSDIANAGNLGYYWEKPEVTYVDNLSYSEKLARVFPNGEYFTDKSQADACMTSVTVPVWVLKSDGTKYSSTRTIKVNSALAEDVVKIFTEIYNDPSQFPIKSMGGYSWRNTASGRFSEHSYGTCIDINPNENYYVSPSGKAITGSHWKPGEDPYSIPGDSIVVRTFAKYGWAWGGNAWGDWNNKDYMHFTYLGN